MIGTDNDGDSTDQRPRRPTTLFPRYIRHRDAECDWTTAGTVRMGWIVRIILIRYGRNDWILIDIGRGRCRCRRETTVTSIMMIPIIIPAFFVHRGKYNDFVMVVTTELYGYGIDL